MSQHYCLFCKTSIQYNSKKNARKLLIYRTVGIYEKAVVSIY